ncbi:MAG: pilus assembly protein PilZ [Deltaproteobacteria bacterium]|nr:pilus assembly protein PilZ [Deltaproteobacteria bacterium]
MKRSPPPRPPADRRAHPRVPLVVREARCIAGMEVFFGYATNVSRGGLFINSPRVRQPGEEFEIRFGLPGLDREFACRARVVWARPYRHDSPHPPGYGLRFLDLPEEDARRIDEWVRSQE